MKQLFFFLLLSANIFSQDFSAVDDKVAKYSGFSKVEDLARKINSDFTTDIDKARAAFYWLAKNIRYNLREYYNPRQRAYSFSYRTEAEKNAKLQALKDNLVNATFQNKMGVCEEYAQSFKKICDLLGIESEVIKGYVRNDVSEIGNVPNRTNHAWNAVKIDGKWLILDATWAAGFEYNGNWIRRYNNYFFDIPTDKIFKTHFPEESIWVLRFGRMSLEEYYNQPIYKNTFLGLDATLISPLNGFIKVKKDEKVILKIKNLDPNVLVFYFTKENKMAQKPVVSVEGNVSTLILKNPRRNTDLYLYINKRDALHFKVNII